MEDRFNFRIPEFTDKNKFIGFQYIELGDSIDELLAGHLGEPQQCTAIKDINNKLIYEGDIVKDSLNSTFIVEYSKDYSTTLLKKNEGSMVFYPKLKLEIIGNVHENSELLEGDN